MSRLTLQFKIDDDERYLGRLQAQVETPTFSGTGWAWSSFATIEEFGSALELYPLLLNNPPRLEAGCDPFEGDDLAIAIEIRPIDPLGHLLVKAEVSDYHDRSDRLRASFQTHYPEVERFRREIARLVRGEANEAVLTGE